ncbi:hypothetical protein ABE096_14010 [Robertmurraya massiliosenegalensis]|uniref:hypothetical protein n=1 Tax=Robertmurraya TaxID=2837507 RepID=UPI0039A6FFC6
MKKNLLYGNGVTIQFGGKHYFNDKIIKRALNNINTKKFPQEIYPREIKPWLEYLHSRIPFVLEGDYDEYPNTAEMRYSLTKFQEKYETAGLKAKIHEIGFEDYFLLNFLVCFKEKIVNPQMFQIKESLRRFFIDSIFNDGKIQSIHQNFSDGFIEFVKQYDNIFTTNYDWNIEKATQKEVHYLHGCFHEIAEEYDPESFRNRLTDAPIKVDQIKDGYEYLYSNALTAYSGWDKKFMLDMKINANKAMDKFVTGLKEQPELWDEVNKWENDDNQLVKNMFESIKLKTEDETLRFRENLSFELFSTISGELSILGLSPYNDNHIFETVANNQEVKKINYYFYDELEAEIVKSILSEKDIEFIDVKGLWDSFQ